MSRGTPNPEDFDPSRFLRRADVPQSIEGSKGVCGGGRVKLLVLARKPLINVFSEIHDGGEGEGGEKGSMTKAAVYKCSEAVLCLEAGY